MRLKVCALLALTAILGGIVYAQDAWWRTPDASRQFVAQNTNTRSASPPQIPVITEHGVEIRQMDFDQMVKAIGLVLTLCSVFQYLLTRLIVQPAIAKEVKQAVMSMQNWASSEFPSKNDFQLHAQDDKHFHGQIEELIRHQNADHDRLREVRDKVLVMETKIR